MNNEKIEAIIWTFCIVVFIMLGARANDMQEENKCGQCTVKLKDKTFLGEYEEFGEFRVIALFGGLVIDNKCMIKWDKEGGYYVTNETTK